MSAIINNSFRKYNADEFIDSITNNSVYLAIGKDDSWGGNSRGEYADGTFSDVLLPAPPLDTTLASSYHWDDFIALKRINSSNVSHVIKRVNWTSGTIYDAYDDIQDDLIDKNFFVFDPDTFNVYKCLDNNSGAASTVKPAGTSVSSNRLADNYRWKFMFQVKQPEVLKYVTSDWIPVSSPNSVQATHPEQKLVEDAAVDGALEHIKITNGGSSYITNTGTVAGVPSSTQVTLDTTALSDNNAYANMDVFIDSGTGNGQIRRISSYDGTTKVATLATAWTTDPSPSTSTYVVAPAVVITSIGTNNGTGAKARVKSVSGGIITDVVIVAGGQDFRLASASVVVAANGVNATLQPVISPVGGHGSDATTELGGAFVMMNTRLTGTEGDKFPVSDDFRKVHVVVNPKVVAVGNAVATETTYSQKPTPELKKNTGQIIYTEFRVPINRAADSTEDIKLVVEF